MESPACTGVAGCKTAQSDAINAAAGREDGTPESSMAALEAAEARDEAEGEGDDAPPDQMKGDKPNPLRRPTAKDWAGRKEDEEKPPFLKRSDEEPDEDERRAQLRRKYLAPSGRLQQRG